MGALGRLLRAMLMRTPDMDAFEREQNHPPLSDAVFAKDAPEWQRTHQKGDSPLFERVNPSEKGTVPFFHRQAKRGWS
jgi:hypothetical protein